MPGIYWYIALAAVSAGICISIFVRNKEYAKLLAFFFFTVMVAYIGEIIVMMLFNSYAYKPGVFSDPYAENIIGHVIPNTTVWPAAGMLSAVYALKKRWMLVIAAIFMILDILFVWLGLYEHHWWQTWMTGIGIFIYCLTMKDWYRKMDRRRYSALRYVMFVMILSFILFEPVAVLLLLGKQAGTIGWYQNPYRDSVVFEFAYHLLVSFASAYFLCVLRDWCWKMVPYILVPFVDIILIQAGILSLSGGWNFLYLLATRYVSLSLFILLEKKYSYHKMEPAQ